MHFRKRSSQSGGSGDKHGPKVELSKEDMSRLKVRTASVHDPVLDAVQEAQPFEQAADTFQANMNRQSYYSGDGEQRIRDVFGQPIVQPDISNPTRSRDERPLDTIRGFEYAISGDPYWAQQLETPRLGFRVRPDFPLFTANPYGNGAGVDGGQGRQPYIEQPVYQAPAAHEVGVKKSKKKKRGLFRRNKK